MEPWDKTCERIAKFYSGLVATLGATPSACDYGSEQSMHLKYAVIADADRFSGKRILDVGCGYGGFPEYLRETGEVFTSYTGVDLSKAMIDEARRFRKGHVSEAYFCEDILTENPGGPSYDIVVANGIFYLLGDAAWIKMNRLIQRMWELTKKTLVFNSLSVWAPQQNVNEYYADPLKVLKACRALTPMVALRHDYLPHDFTVIMRK